MQTYTVSPKTFIGRSQEIAEISQLLAEPNCRLLSLVGQGGIGKSQLALELATVEQMAFPDGIFFVELAPLSPGADILMTIAEALPFCFQSDKGEAHEQFFAYLHEKAQKKFLLILDNFEHLLADADIISAILGASQALKILVTSREVLNLQEEWVRQISGLNYPENTECANFDDYSALRLFVDRARMIRSDLDLSAHYSSIIEICRLVEGMPLAIELAVGWLKTLQPAEIAQEIQRNLDILVTRSRNLAERHRSIRSVFSQSWQNMSADERQVFMRLSIFRGGFSREAAEAIAGASLHSLASLLDKSLIRLGATGRYEIHELLRQYGAEQLDAAHASSTVEVAYSNYYLKLLARLENDIKSAQQTSALDKIKADFENIRRAWQFAITANAYPALSAACESLHFFADMRGHYLEVVSLFLLAIEQAPQELKSKENPILSRIQARLMRLIVLSNLRLELDVPVGIDNCLAVARVGNDPAELGFCLTLAGTGIIWECDSDRVYTNRVAQSYFQEAYAIYQKLNDKFYMGEILAWIACVVDDEDASQSGAVLLQQSLEIRNEIGDCNGIAWITLNLAEMALFNGDYPTCEHYSREALLLMRELGSVKGILQAMFKLAQTLSLKGEIENARLLSQEMREIADLRNNLDGKMLAAGLLAFLIAIGDEAYIEARSLAQMNQGLSLEPFFGGHNAILLHWVRSIANAGLGQFEAVRANYPNLFWEAYDNPASATVCLVLEALALHAEAGHEEAVTLLALAAQQITAVNGWLEVWPRIAQLQSALQVELGAERYQIAWEHGAKLELESSIRAILERQNSITPLRNHHGMMDSLSERELEVLALVGVGLSNREIAERLVLSVGTVKVHTRNIYSKLNVSSRTQALAQASKLKLL